MIIIGITGSIGMGKSTIASMFNLLNIQTLDSDQIVKNLLNSDVFVLEKIKKNWPNCIQQLNNKDVVNRLELSKLIFSNKLEKEKLEKIIHPLVFKNRNKFLEEAKKENRIVVGLDVPLLYETNTHKMCNYVFLAIASKKK